MRIPMAAATPQTRGDTECANLKVMAKPFLEEMQNPSGATTRQRRYLKTTKRMGYASMRFSILFVILSVVARPLCPAILAIGAVEMAYRRLPRRANGGYQKPYF